MSIVRNDLRTVSDAIQRKFAAHVEICYAAVVVKSAPYTAWDASAASHAFVLVHGAWHGSWCWRRVAGALRAAGHLVFTPTLTGLGERFHLLRPGLTIE